MSDLPVSDLPITDPRRDHRAQAHQRTLDLLREEAKISSTARELLARIDPSGTLRYWPPEEGDSDE
jgi:hypothetical protein